MSMAISALEVWPRQPRTSTPASLYLYFQPSWSSALRKATRSLTLVATFVKCDTSDLQLSRRLDGDGEAIVGRPLLRRRRRRARPRTRPLAHAVDAFLHGDRQRHDLARRRQDTFGAEVAAGVEGVVERADDRLLDLGAREL